MGGSTGGVDLLVETGFCCGSALLSLGVYMVKRGNGSICEAPRTYTRFCQIGTNK